MPRHRTAALAGLLAALAIGLAGCKGGKDAEKKAPPAPKVTVVRPIQAPVNDYWEYNGYLGAIETVEVRARVKGFLGHRHFQEGRDVAGAVKWLNGRVLYPGDLLYQIDKREYVTAINRATAELAKSVADVTKSGAEVSKADADIALATANRKRTEESFNRNVGSQADVDASRASVDVSKARFDAAKAELKAAEASRDAAASALRTAEIQLGYTDIRAQLSGQIGRTLVDEGNLVGQSEQTLLTTIIKVDELYVEFDLPEQDMLDYLRDAERYNLPTPPKQTVPMEIRVPGQNGPWHKGHIDYVEGSVNPGTGTVRARGVIGNPRRPVTDVRDVRQFVPGMYVQVRVPRGKAGEPMFTLPEDAIMSGQEGRFVYVVGPNDLVEKRVVRVGPSVWKVPPTQSDEAAAGWAMVNPKPGPPPEKGPPPPTRRAVYSVVAILPAPNPAEPKKGGLAADDRVVVDGVQRARPGSPVAPEEWVMKAPTP